MPIKKRFVARDTRLEDQWASREIGNPNDPAMWEFTDDGVKTAKPVSYLAELIEDYFGEKCDHRYDSQCEACRVRKEYYALKRNANLVKGQQWFRLL